jgi:hypothetical protein
MEATKFICLFHQHHTSLDFDATAELFIRQVQMIDADTQRYRLLREWNVDAKRRRVFSCSNTSTLLLNYYYTGSNVQITSIYTITNGLKRLPNKKYQSKAELKVTHQTLKR